MGDDRVIPFRRVAEGKLSKLESSYAGEVADPWLAAVLAHASEAEDWTVYGMPPEAAQAFRQTVQEVTDVSLP